MLEVFARQSRPDSRNAGYTGERLLNLFLRPSDAAQQAVIMGASGPVEVCDLGEPVRAVISRGALIYAVAGSSVYKIKNGVPANVGTVSPDGDVYMAENGKQVAIVVDDTYYICDGVTTTAYTTGAIEKPKTVTYQDGYFVVTGRSAGRGDAITVSALDGTTFDNLDFVFAENAPDAIRGCISDHGELWVLGTKTVEVFYNSGAVDFPFARNSGALMEHGCLSGKTVAKEDNSVFWVRPDGAVVRADGGTPRVISTPEVQGMVVKSNVLCGFTFTDKGHKFYAVSIAGSPTLVFDMITGLWHERSSGLDYAPWSCCDRATAGQVEYLGTTTGKVVKLDPDSFSDDGGVLLAEAVSIPIDEADDYFSVNKIAMRVRSGAVDIGRDPQIVLQTTRNGRDWSNEKWRKLGTLGEYSQRVVWHGLGAFRHGQFRIKISDPVPRDMYGIKVG